MVSRDHEILVELFRRRPELVRELLQDRLDAELGDGDAELASIDLSQATPVEYRCDAFVLLRRASRELALGAIVEVQRHIDADKHLTWPSYVAVARQRHACPIVLLVIATDAAVARWASTPIVLGHPGFVLTPIVFGPAEIPRLTDPEAMPPPELAVLSVLAHPEPEVARVALLVTSDLPPEQRTLYWDVIVEALPRAVRHALEDLMANPTYKPKHELTIRLNQKFVEAEERGLAEGTAKGLAEGTAKGLAEGTAKGLAKGLEALRALLRKQLVLKFGALPHEVEERLACATADELELYGERLVTADALAHVFA